ncbi:MAG: nicotinate phosphoribosyltransferase [Anaerolineae bacterium]
MSIFDHQRLTNHTLKLNIEGLRQGLYSDKYFENVVRVLSGMHAAAYTFAGKSARPLPADVTNIHTSELSVEAQLFNRRVPFTLVAGVDVALAMLRHASGYYEADTYLERWQHLEVEAVEDGTITHYDGDTEDVEPVIRIRGQYRDFALLETPILGVLTRASRIATNVYRVLEVSNGKPVLYFPARFDLPETQALDGYAYQIAVKRYNADFGKTMTPAISTDAQGLWWNGRGGGTVPHALIAMFLGDTAETMVAFARYAALSVPRIALVDFNNDCVKASIDTINAFWPHFREALETADTQAQRRWTLYGVRLDTSANMRDVSLPPDSPGGVNAALVHNVRHALDHAWESWNVPSELEDAAKDYCHSVRIVVTGGFNRERIQKFEAAGVPVDVYGVGSSLLRNDSETNTDYTMDIVRLQLGKEWLDVAKVGRKPNDNPLLQAVNLADL